MEVFVYLFQAFKQRSFVEKKRGVICHVCFPFHTVQSTVLFTHCNGRLDVKIHRFWQTRACFIESQVRQEPVGGKAKRRREAVCVLVPCNINVSYSIRREREQKQKNSKKLCYTTLLFAVTTPSLAATFYFTAALTDIVVVDSIGRPFFSAFTVSHFATSIAIKNT